MKKKRILILADYYLPAFRAGGPIRTLSSLVEALSDTFDFTVIARDRDVGDKQPFGHIDSQGWASVGGARVFYLSSTSIVALRHAMNQVDYDILYINSVCSRAFSIQALCLRFLHLLPKKKTIIAPKGEFSPNALKIKAKRKKIYLRLAKMLGLFKSVLWHAANSHEKEDIQEELGRQVDVLMAVDIPDASAFVGINTRSSKKIDQLRLVFLSRITPMKNLCFALDVLKYVKSSVVFDLYGPVRDQAYWSCAEKVIKSLPDNVKVRYHGEVLPNKVPEILSRYDAFFLPTLGESFGHVIFESLLAACPVIISDKTMWKNLDAQRAGWDLSLLSPNEFVRVIEFLASMSVEEHQALKESSRQFALDWFENSDIVLSNRQLFEKALI